MNSDIFCGSGVFIAENATVVGDVTLGDDVNIWFGVVIRGDKDKIIIGDGSNIQDNCVVHTTADRLVTIGKQVSVGHGAIIHGCTIHDRVLIGMGAIVMNDAVIGEGSIVGAGAVVTERSVIPPNSLVMGIPGKVIRETSSEQAELIVEIATSYIELAGKYR